MCGSIAPQSRVISHPCVHNEPRTSERLFFLSVNSLVSLSTSSSNCTRMFDMAYFVNRGGMDRMDSKRDYSEGSRTTTMYGLQAGFVWGTHDILPHPFIRLAVMERQYHRRRSLDSLAQSQIGTMKDDTCIFSWKLPYRRQLTLKYTLGTSVGISLFSNQNKKINKSDLIGQLSNLT